ncbi:unnamed protein product [Bubo scandiacus]
MITITTSISYCGPYASAYKLGDCSLGWAFYTAIGALNYRNGLSSLLGNEDQRIPRKQNVNTWEFLSFILLSGHSGIY